MEKDSELVPILFVWDGYWDCGIKDNRWRFNGKQAKTELLHVNTTFSQLLDKAYAMCKPSQFEYDVDMSSWFAYDKSEPLPPTPLQDENDVRILFHFNKMHPMSVPICLIIKKRTNLIESQSSNKKFVPETLPHVALPSVDKCKDKGKSIVKEVPTDDENNDFEYLLNHNYDTDSTAHGSPICQQASFAPECPTGIDLIPPSHGMPFAPRDYPPFYPNGFTEPHHTDINAGTRKDNSKKKSVGTSQSCVGNQRSKADSDSTNNTTEIENDFEVGQVFFTKKEFNYRLALISIFKNKEHKIYKTDSTRIVAKCIDPACGWKIRAKPLRVTTDGDGNKDNEQNTDIWIVGKYNNIHTCSIEIMNHDHRQATSKVLGRIIKYRYDMQKTLYPPNAIIDEILHRLNVTISYHKAWRAGEEALKLVRGSPADSFMQIKAFFARMEQVNPGTVTDVETDNKGHFKYCFMALGVSIRGFVSCIRPVLAIDGTHLRGKYRGTLLLACGLDGNNQIYPLAFSIVDSENDDSWEYFLGQIHSIIGDLPDLAFVSDRHNSIASALEKVFPDAHHGICIQHLRQNVVARFKGVNISPLLLCAAKTYNEGEFSHLMTEIWRVSHEAHDYLTVEAKVWQWARVHFPGRRYSIMTTNIAESLNAVLKDVRDYPIVPLLDAILMKLISWFAKRQEKAVKMQSTLTTWADKRVEARGRVARRMRVQALDRFTYYVFDGGRNPTVDLRAKTCTCTVFQLEQLPCTHALAACSEANMSRYDLASKYYTSNALQIAYAETIFPVGHEDLWKASGDEVLPPIMRVPAGRPRKKRIPSQGEDQVKRKCGRCGSTGHNRKSCKNPLPVASEQGKEVKKKCGRCGGTRHNRKTCKNPIPV